VTAEKKLVKKMFLTGKFLFPSENSCVTLRLDMEGLEILVCTIVLRPGL